MERSENPGTVKSSERPTSNWRSREENEDNPRDPMEGSVTSAGRPQTRIERPVSRRGLQSAQGNVPPRATTPARNAIARPPSASVYSARVMTGNTRLATAGTSLTRLNTGLPSSIQINANALDRPITQQGIAAVRPGTTRGLPMNRQIQDKRYYEGLVQLKIRELSQEIGAISREIESQNKERATFLHYDNRAKELAAELTELQGQLGDYNIVIDKSTSNVEEERIDLETEEMRSRNDRTLKEIENLFEQRRMKEQQLRDATEKIESEEKKATKLIETMDRESREKYEILSAKKSVLDTEIGQTQREIDLISREKRRLEEEISLSQIKQEAVKLRVKLVELEGKRNKLQEERDNKLSPEEERERLLSKVKQENAEIAAADRRMADAEKRIGELEHELEQLETDLEEVQSEKQVKYKELKKREEAMEQFMPSFEQNKTEEIEKLESLEERVVERLEELSYAVDSDPRFTTSEEIALLQMDTSREDPQETKIDRSFEGLTREHARLQQTQTKMANLEKRLRNELVELNDKISKRRSELVVLEDLDGLKARSELQYEKLVGEREDLKKKQPGCKQALERTRNEHEEIKKRLDNNETYLQISALEAKLEKVKENNKSLEDFMVEGKNRVNYQPLREQTLALRDRYNSVLRESFKSSY